MMSVQSVVFSVKSFEHRISFRVSSPFLDVAGGSESRFPLRAVGVDEKSYLLEGFSWAAVL